jgi:hypothetical protein
MGTQTGEPEEPGAEDSSFEETPATGASVEESSSEVASTEAPGFESSAGGEQREDSSFVRRVEIGYVEGDLAIRGTNDPHVRVNAHDFDDEAPIQPGAEPSGGLRLARLSGHAELLVPRRAVISVRQVDGHLHAEDIAGRLSIGSVADDAILVGLAHVELGRVEGDLQARACGIVRVQWASDDVLLDDVRGIAELGRIGGDLAIYQAATVDAREAIGGDVQLDGCAEGAFLRGPIGGDLQVSACAGELRIGPVGGDLRVRLCQGVVVDGTVGGDCDLAEIAGEADIHGAVGGDLSASLVGGVTIAGAVGGDADVATVAQGLRLRTVGGDFQAEGLAGPVAIDTVGGDAEIRTCLGALKIRMVGGDLTIQRAVGGVAVTRVGGDAELDTPLSAGAEYQVRAGGDIHLRVRGEVNARFVAQTLGGEIRTRLPLAVERGRRRNLVGVLGRGDAAVTLHSDGGDISIAGVYGNEEDDMSDEFGPTGVGTEDAERSAGAGESPRSWEGSFGGHKFRVHWAPSAQDATGEAGSRSGSRRGFAFEWEHNPDEDRKTAEDFEHRMNDLRDKAEQAARRAAEQAQRYAERAARRARETDWEAVGREVRSAIERAMSELEDTVNQLRRDFETRRGAGGAASSGTGPGASGAQRVRIEHDEDGAAYGAAAAEPSATPTTSADVEGRRRAILEDLRAGIIPIDEAERRLGELR